MIKFKSFFLYCTGIPADYYSTPENIYGDSENNPENSCYDTEDYKALRGLQNISPCQYSKCLHRNQNRLLFIHF